MRTAAVKGSASIGNRRSACPTHEGVCTIGGTMMDKQVLAEILVKHAEWLHNEPGKERAYLQGADLQWADLREANLREDDLRETNLREADLDFSCWPLWCGSKDVKVDRRLAAQLAAHFCVLDCDDQDYLAARTALLEFAMSSHRAIDLGLKDSEDE